MHANGIIVTNEFAAWYGGLVREEQVSVERVVALLEQEGVALPFPYSSGVSGSRYSGMRELRVQHRGRPVRILYLFDPERNAVLLLGGEKTGDDRWYEKALPRADRLFKEYLEEVAQEQKHRDRSER